MSHYGGHDWERGFTCAAKITNYRCRACGMIFAHHYAKTPDLERAMKLARVELCDANSNERNHHDQ